MNASFPFKKDALYFWLGLFILHAVLRFTTLHVTFLDIDESQFAGFAKVLINGGLPYRDSLDTKSLGIYLFYATVLKAFGAHSMFGVRVVSILWTFAEAVLLAACCQTSQLKTNHVGRFAALAFIVFTTTFIPKYLASSINSVMILFLIASACASISNTTLANPKNQYDFFAGFLAGIALLFKYQAGIQFFVFAGFCLGKPGFIKRVFLFGLGMCVPFALQGFALYRLGVWTDFVQWSLLGSGAYIVQGSASISWWHSFLTRAVPFLCATAPIWILSGIAINKVRFDKRFGIAPNPLTRYTLWWTTLSVIPVSMSGRFYPHYFLQLLPAACILAALGWHNINWQKMRTLKLTLVAVTTLIPTFFFGLLRVDHDLFLRYFPDDSLAEQKIIGTRVQRLSTPDQKIFVWGFATAIYFYADRDPMSRFLWTDLLVGRVPGAAVTTEQAKAFRNSKAWDAFWEDWKKNPPAFFIDTSPGNIHHYATFPPQNDAKLAQEIAEHYQIIENVSGAAIYQRK